MTSRRRLSRRQLVASGALAVTTAPITRVNAQQATPASPTAIPETGATPVTSTWAIWVDRSDVRFDEPFNVGVYGLSPLEEVTIRAAFHDGLNYLWESKTSYIADEQGNLNLSAIDPAEGPFDVPDAMGLIWAATSSTAYGYTPNFTMVETIEITCQRTNESQTQRVNRTFGPLQPAPLNISEPDGIIARYYPPLVETPAPAVIIIGGSEGGLSPYNEAMNQLLNQAGYAVLQLAWFGIGHLPEGLTQIPLEYFGTAITWLQGQEGIDPDRIGMMGTSRGGEGALLIASHYPEIRAVVSISGSGMIWPGLVDLTTAAWTWQGEDIPFLSYGTSDAGLYEVPEASDTAPYEIPVEQINGPILMLCGEADVLWPSSYLCQFAWDRLAREGHAFADQFLRYPGNGHAFYLPYQPLFTSSKVLVPPYGLVDLGGTQVGSAFTAPASWAAIKQHLASSLKQP